MAVTGGGRTCSAVSRAGIGCGTWSDGSAFWRVGTETRICALNCEPTGRCAGSLLPIGAGPGRNSGAGTTCSEVSDSALATVIEVRSGTVSSGEASCPVSLPCAASRRFSAGGASPSIGCEVSPVTSGVFAGSGAFPRAANSSSKAITLLPDRDGSDATGVLPGPGKRVRISVSMGSPERRSAHCIPHRRLPGF